MRPTPRGQRGAELLLRLVVAVQHQPFGRHPGRQGDVELPARRDVELHALLVGQTGHGPAQEGLGGIGHPVAPGVDGLPAGAAQVVLVVDEERRAELGRQVQQVDPAHPQVPVRSPTSAVRGSSAALHRRRGHHGVGRHGHAGYGRCGRPARDGSRTCRLRSSPAPAPVAQRIEHRPPEPVAQVRVLPGAPHAGGAGGALPGAHCRGAPGALSCRGALSALPGRSARPGETEMRRPAGRSGRRVQTGDGGPGQRRALGVQVAADDRAGGGGEGLGVDPGANVHGKGQR